MQTIEYQWNSNVNERLKKLDISTTKIDWELYRMIIDQQASILYLLWYVSVGDKDEWSVLCFLYYLNQIILVVGFCVVLTPLSISH
jgi:hypothetical protein